MEASSAKEEEKTAFQQEWREYIRDPRVAIDESGHIVYASPAFCHLAGVELSNAVGSSASELLSIASKKRKPSKKITSLKTGSYPVLVGPESSRHEFHFEWLSVPDGRRYLIGSAVKDEAGKGSAFTGFPAENPEEKLRHFTDLSHDAMAVISFDGNFNQTNNTFIEIFGYKTSRLNEMNFLDLVFTDDRHTVRTSLQSLAKGEEREDNTPPVNFETRMLDNKGNILFVDLRLKRIGNEIYCVGRDLTAIKNHEAQLKRRERQLSEAESIGHMGHWHWHVGDELIKFSDEIYRIFGVSPDKFEPALDNFGDRIHRRDIGRLLQAFQRAILEKNDYDMEFRAIHPDGEVRYVRCQGRCEKDEEGEVIGLFGIMQDITERTIYEINLREAKEAAEQAYAAKSQFLANMSHELRTPLNAIIGFSEMMQRQLLGPIGTEKYIEYIDGIRESGEHLLDLISDILNMSKIEAGKYDLDLENFNLAKVIRMAMHMVESRAQEAGLQLTADIEDEELTVIADRRAVMQIALNLLSNSVKFTEPGGHVKIEIACREEYVSLKVIDNGAGIPANKLKSITRPFEQASSHYTREHDGSGLGLAITKELAEMHGGAIHIDSAVGAGTTVTIRLPYDASRYYSAGK